MKFRRSNWYSTEKENGVAYNYARDILAIAFWRLEIRITLSEEKTKVTEPYVRGEVYILEEEE